MKQIISFLLIGSQFFTSLAFAGNSYKNEACDFLSASEKAQVFHVAIDNNCLIGVDSAERAGLDFHQVGFTEILSQEDQLARLESGKANALVVDDALVEVLSQDNEIWPVVLGIVAADAALLGTMWAVSVSSAK